MVLDSTFYVIRDGGVISGRVRVIALITLSMAFIAILRVMFTLKDGLSMIFPSARYLA